MQAEFLPTASEPLTDAADPRLYLPRTSSERVLAALVRWLEGGRGLALVAGAPGAGTTLLLRVLERRESARRRVLFSPFLHMEPEALERWLIALAPEPRGLPRDPLLAALGFDGARVLPPLLLVDDAHAAEPETCQALGRLVRRRAPALKVVLGGCPGSGLRQAAEAFGGEAEYFELAPWSVEELRALGAVLCVHPGLDGAARARLTGVDVAALASQAQGSARLLKNALVRRCAALASAPGPLEAAVVAATLPEPGNERSHAPSPAPAAAPVAVRGVLPAPAAAAPRAPAGPVAPRLPAPARRGSPARPPGRQRPSALRALLSGFTRAPATRAAPPRRERADAASARAVGPASRAASSPRRRRPDAREAAPNASDSGALHSLLSGFADTPRVQPPALAAKPPAALSREVLPPPASEARAETAPAPTPPAPPPPVEVAPEPKPARAEPARVRAPAPAPEPRGPIPRAPTPAPTPAQKPMPRPAPAQRARTRPPARAVDGSSRFSRSLFRVGALLALVSGFGLGVLGDWLLRSGDLAPNAFLGAWAAASIAAPPEAESAPRVAAAPPAVEAAPRVAAAPSVERWSVHVNARPWAWIRIDGREVGATPLVQPDLAAGPHEFEATFPDGRRTRRVLEIGPDTRFVAFQ